jgi:threonine dehydratase
VLVPAGGGGLLAGVGSALRQLDSGIRVIGVQSEASPYLEVEFHGGDMSRVIERDSLADGLAGAVEPGSETVPIMHQVADDFVLVSEEAIASAIAHAYAQHGQVLEGAGAVALAAVLSGGPFPRPAIALATGGNIDRARFEAVLSAVERR